MTPRKSIKLIRHGSDLRNLTLPVDDPLGNDARRFELDLQGVCQADRGHQPTLGTIPTANDLVVQFDHLHRWNYISPWEVYPVLSRQSLQDVFARLFTRFDQRYGTVVVLQSRLSPELFPT